MQIGWIKAVDFRNYPTLSLTPAPRLNVLHGPNGHGKTNLLEALGLLLTGRSFRTPRVAEIPRWGTQAAALTGDLVRADAVSEARRTLRRTIERLDDGTWQSRGNPHPSSTRRPSPVAASSMASRAASFPCTSRR